MHPPPIKLQLHIKFQLLAVCSFWTIAWKKNSVITHQPTHQLTGLMCEDSQLLLSTSAISRKRIGGVTITVHVISYVKQFGLRSTYPTYNQPTKSIQPGHLFVGKRTECHPTGDELFRD